jgi:UDP-N-acetylmuramoylalanine--D-glutamate ligase
MTAMAEARVPREGRLLIIGAARSGLAAARLALARGYEVLLHDDHLDMEQLRERLDGALAAVHLGGDLPEDLALVVPSPVIPPSHPLVAQALAQGIPVHSEPDFARAWFAGQVLAVTGSNGKTTTTLLAEAVLRAAGLRAEACGNVGHPFSLVALADPQPDWAVLEVSSYQLELSRDLRVRAALLLNMSEDHLARHGSMRGYLAAKWRLTGQLAPEGCVVLNGGDALLREEGRDLSCRVRRFSSAGGAEARVDAAGLWLAGHGEAPFIRAGGPRLLGAHNLENMAAVLLAAVDLGLDLDTVRRAMLDFPPVEHRIETVRTLDGARWVNDSKATNVDSTVKALAVFPAGSVVLLAGGEAKTADYHEADALARERVKALVAYGRDGGVIADWFRDRLPVHRVADLADAVALARTLARPGDVVLLSPMCASFDQFANFEERGTRFKELVAALPESGSVVNPA